MVRCWGLHLADPIYILRVFISGFFILYTVDGGGVVVSEFSTNLVTTNLPVKYSQSSSSATVTVSFLKPLKLLLHWMATIGAGTLLGDVTKRLHDAGGRAIAHGVCPQIGIGAK